MKTKHLIKRLDKAIEKYNEFKGICDTIANEAQKNIEWSDNITCDYYPSDGICLCIEDEGCVYIVPADDFFEYRKNKDGGFLTKIEIKQMAI